jgi:uncharacterized membrane protein YeaQ/YmgE (transglycosylase-associated protein family)
MAIITTGVVNLVIILIIGIVVGLLFNRYGQTWFRRQFTTRHTDITSSLVGIAGSFIGFHIGVILGLLPSPLMLYIAAAIGAVLVLWLWRGR